MAWALGVVVVLFSFAHTQPKPSFQFYGGFGTENANNNYKTIGLDAFLESTNWFYTGSLSYLDATLNTFVRSSQDTSTSNFPPMTETLNSTFFSSTKRYTVSNRFEYFLPSGFNVALTANYAHEESNFPSSFSYVYDPRPPGFGWDTTFNFNAHRSSNYLVAGLEFSFFNEANKLGFGALLITDFNGLNNYQPYLLYSSNPYRLLVLKATAGGLYDTTFNPFIQTKLSYLLTPDFELTGSVRYSRTTFVYDILDRYTSFYREKNEIEVGLAFIYHAWPGTKLFVNGKFDRNDRFNMWIATTGVYFEP